MRSSPACCNSRSRIAGARRAMLALLRDGRLMAHAAAEAADDGAIEVTALAAPVDEQLGGWPLRVLDYVARTGADLVLADASSDSRFERDPYIRDHRVLSVLCAPLHRGGELVGVLYLENSLGHDIFTSRQRHHHPHHRRPGRHRHRGNAGCRRTAAGDGHRIQQVRAAAVPWSVWDATAWSRCNWATPWPPTSPSCSATCATSPRCRSGCPLPRTSNS